VSTGGGDSCLLIKRAVCNAIDGLDERFGLGMLDDDDLAARARRAGFTGDEKRMDGRNNRAFHPKRLYCRRLSGLSQLKFAGFPEELIGILRPLGSIVVFGGLELPGLAWRGQDRPGR
jgi:hypothetical protein